MDSEVGVRSGSGSGAGRRPAARARTGSEDRPLRHPVPVERLAPREREVAETVFRSGEITVAELCREVQGVGNSALRSMLRRLEKKRVLRHRREGNRFVYMPARASDEVRQSVLRRIAIDYFEGSVERLASEARELCGAPPA